MGHGTWDMGRFEAAGKIFVVNMIYGTFQCKLWQFVLLSKKVQHKAKIIDKYFAMSKNVRTFAEQKSKKWKNNK